MAKPRAKAPDGYKVNPRKEHPFLVGCTEREAQLIARGAKKVGLGPCTFLRDLALFRARQLLGLKQPQAVAG